MTFSWRDSAGYEGANALDIEINNVGAAVNVFLTGYGQPTAFNYDYTTLAFSAAPNTSVETWAQSHANNTGEDRAFDVAVAGKGNVYIAGVRNLGSGSANWMTIKYNQAGTLQHQIDYSTFTAEAYAIADSCAGRTHVAGFRGTNSDDFWTILYDQQQRVHLPATAMSLATGTYTNNSGQLSNLWSSDDNHVTMHPGVVLSPSQWSVNLVIDAEVPPGLTINELCFHVESSAPSGIEQRIELYNFVTGSWVTMDQRATTVADSHLHLAAQYDPNEFVSNGDPQVVRARVMFRQAGPVLNPPWTARIDFAGWHVVN